MTEELWYLSCLTLCSHGGAIGLLKGERMWEFKNTEIINITKKRHTFMRIKKYRYIIISIRTLKRLYKTLCLFWRKNHTHLEEISSFVEDELCEEMSLFSSKRFHSFSRNNEIGKWSDACELRCSNHVTYIMWHISLSTIIFNTHPPYQVVYLIRDKFPIILFACTAAAVLLPFASAPPPPQHPPVGSDRVFAHHFHHCCVIIWGSD